MLSLTLIYTLPNFSWYDIPKQTKKPYWTEPYYSTFIKNLKLVSYCVPMFRNDTFLGVVTIDFALEPFDEIFKKSFEHKSTQFVILSKKGQYISHPEPNKILESSIFDESGKHLSLKERKYSKDCQREW